MSLGGLTPKETIRIHRGELDWVARGYARLAEALRRDYNDVRIDDPDGTTGLHGGMSVHVSENGEWQHLGKLLSPYGIAEILEILRKAEEQDNANGSP